MDFCQFLSIFVNFCQFLSIFVNFCQFFNFCQFNSFYRIFLKLGVLNINEIFGEEDLILNRKREYTVLSQTPDGELRIISKKNFFQRVMRDDTTARLLEEKVRKKEEFYSSKFLEIKAIKSEILKNSEEKNAIFKEENTKNMYIGPKSSLNKYLTLKKTLMKFEGNKVNASTAFNEKEFENMSHSFIFKNVKLLEEKNR